MSSVPSNRYSTSKSILGDAFPKTGYKGMEHLHDHYGVLHTQSFPDAVEALAQVCANNGGELK